MFTFDENMKLFLRKREIPIRAHIDAKKQEGITNAIEYLNAQDSRTPILLRLDSSGGDAWPGRMIVDAVSNSVAPIDALVTGSAQSAAFGILQACRDRMAYEHVCVCFHRTRLLNAYICETEKERRGRKQFEQLYEVFLRMLSRRSKQSLRNLRAWGLEERQFMAREALGLGFIDKIVRKSQFQLGSQPAPRR